MDHPTHPYAAMDMYKCWACIEGKDLAMAIAENCKRVFCAIVTSLSGFKDLAMAIAAKCTRVFLAIFGGFKDLAMATAANCTTVFWAVVNPLLGIKDRKTEFWQNLTGLDGTDFANFLVLLLMATWVKWLGVQSLHSIPGASDSADVWNEFISRVTEFVVKVMIWPIFFTGLLGHNPCYTEVDTHGANGQIPNRWQSIFQNLAKVAPFVYIPCLLVYLLGVGTPPTFVSMIADGKLVQLIVMALPDIAALVGALLGASHLEWVCCQHILSSQTEISCFPPDWDLEGEGPGPMAERGLACGHSMRPFWGFKCAGIPCVLLLVLFQIILAASGLNCAIWWYSGGNLAEKEMLGQLAGVVFGVVMSTMFWTYLLSIASRLIALNEAMQGFAKAVISQGIQQGQQGMLRVNHAINVVAYFENHLATSVLLLGVLDVNQMTALRLCNQLYWVVPGVFYALNKWWFTNHENTVIWTRQHCHAVSDDVWGCINVTLTNVIP